MYYETFCIMEDKIMELVKENITVNQVCTKGTVRSQVDEDIIVPDVKPDILKILQLDASACVTDETVTDGRASAEGRVDLKILYIPDSETEKIKSINASFDFVRNIDNKAIKSGMTAVISANVENAEFSLINSRKLRVKVTVALDYEIACENNIEIAVDAEDSGSAEVLKDNILLQNCVGICSESFKLCENIQVSASQSAIGEILKVDARITDSEYKAVTGKIIIKGAAAASVLYTDEEGQIRFMEAEIPFTEVIECEEASDDTVCDIDYSVSSVDCEVKEDSDGDRRIAALEICIRAQVKATENVAVDMISDCYEPYMKTELIKEETELEEVISRPQTQCTVRETVEVGEDAPAVSGVYDVITRPKVSDTRLENGKLVTEGKIETYILYLTGSEDNPVYSLKRDIPFSCAMETDADGDGLIPEIKAEVRHTAYNLNMAGEIELRCILALNANIVRKRTIELIEDIVTENRSEAENRGIVIYFVQSGDTLWEIAKRYAVPMGAVTEFNSLTDGSDISVGTRLFIPGA